MSFLNKEPFRNTLTTFKSYDSDYDDHQEAEKNNRHAILTNKSCNDSDLFDRREKRLGNSSMKKKQKRHSSSFMGFKWGSSISSSNSKNNQTKSKCVHFNDDNIVTCNSEISNSQFFLI